MALHSPHIKVASGVSSIKAINKGIDELFSSGMSFESVIKIIDEVATK